MLVLGSVAGLGVEVVRLGVVVVAGVVVSVPGPDCLVRDAHVERLPPLQRGAVAEVRHVAEPSLETGASQVAPRDSATTELQLNHRIQHLTLGSEASNAFSIENTPFHNPSTAFYCSDCLI